MDEYEHYVNYIYNYLDCKNINDYELTNNISELFIRIIKRLENYEIVIKESPKFKTNITLEVQIDNIILKFICWIEKFMCTNDYNFRFQIDLFKKEKLESVFLLDDTLFNSYNMLYYNSELASGKEILSLDDDDFFADITPSGTLYIESVEKFIDTLLDVVGGKAFECTPGYSRRK